MNTPPITVICGLIKNEKNHIFIARRAAHKVHAGQWEFPGGKLETNETHQDCLQRELREELGMEVQVGLKAGETTHDFSKFSIKLIAYYCTFIKASFELSDHDRYAWVPSKQLLDYPLSESDLIFAKLLNSEVWGGKAQFLEYVLKLYAAFYLFFWYFIFP